MGLAGIIGSALAGGAEQGIDIIDKKMASDLQEARDKRIAERQFELQERSNKAADERQAKALAAADKRASDAQAASESRQYEFLRAQGEREDKRISSSEKIAGDRDAREREAADRRAVLAWQQQLVAGHVKQLQVAEEAVRDAAKDPSIKPEELAAMRAEVKRRQGVLDATMAATQALTAPSQGGGGGVGRGRARVDIGLSGSNGASPDDPVSILQSEVAKSNAALEAAKARNDPDAVARNQNDLIALERELARLGKRPDSGPIGEALGASDVSRENATRDRQASSYRDAFNAATAAMPMSDRLKNDPMYQKYVQESNALTRGEIMDLSPDVKEFAARLNKAKDDEFMQGNNDYQRRSVQGDIARSRELARQQMR